MIHFKIRNRLSRRKPARCQANLQPQVRVNTNHSRVLINNNQDIRLTARPPTIQPLHQPTRELHQPLQEAIQLPRQHLLTSSHLLHPNPSLPADQPHPILELLLHHPPPASKEDHHPLPLATLELHLRLQAILLILHPLDQATQELLVLLHPLLQAIPELLVLLHPQLQAIPELLVLLHPQLQATQEVLHPLGHHLDILLLQELSLLRLQDILQTISQAPRLQDIQDPLLLVTIPDSQEPTPELDLHLTPTILHSPKDRTNLQLQEASTDPTPTVEEVLLKVRPILVLLSDCVLVK